MEWQINGQTLHFGSKPILINPDPNKTDTLLYKQNDEAKWDTIICNVKEPLAYKFIYNTCCDGFNVSGPDDEFLAGKVNFRLVGRQNDESFLGTLGEAGIIVTTDTKDTLSPRCRSAMSPNIYSLSFKEVKICSDTLICKEAICLLEKDKEELNYEFKFKTISNKMKILFMPLSSEPIQVTYNIESDKITVK